MSFHPSVAVAALLLAADLSATADDVIRNSCEKPGDLQVQATNREQEQFRKGLDKYRDCMDAYIKGETALARLHSDAAQAAIAEFNDYVKQVNERHGSQE